jgi:phospholipid/cholesterol/gamma-HCH transport system substrate-binding protein
LKKEVTVGLIGILFIIAFFWAFTKVKRSGVLGRHFSIRVATDNMYNLRNKQFVMLNGWQVGVIAGQEIAPDGKYIAIIDFLAPLELPNNTIARITYISVLGGREIDLIIDTTQKATGILKDGDLIRGFKEDIPQQISNGLAPFTKPIDKFLAKYPMDSLEKLAHDTKIKLAGYEQSTKAISNALAKNDKNIRATIKNMAELSTDLRKKTPDFQKQLQTINKALVDVQVKNPEKQIKDMTQKVSALGDTITSKSATIANVNKGIDNASASIEKIATNPTVQKYFYTDSIPANLKATVSKTQTTVKDVYEHPEKYRKINKKK